MIVLAVLLEIAAWICLTMGHGSLRDSKNHIEYGVESESLHRRFAWLFILAGWAAGLIGGYLLIVSIFG